MRVLSGGVRKPMTAQTSAETGKYLYGVVAGSQDRDYGPIGIDGSTVYSIADTRVAAVVSDVPNQKLRPERRRLAAHQQVLKRLLAEDGVLPMSFGIIADGDEAIRRIISSNRTEFIEQLRRVEGKVEMGLRVVWDAPNIFEYFVNTHAELRAVRDRLLGSHREPPQADKIEAGRIFERILNEDREAHTAKVESLLSRCCYETKRNPPRDEREVMNLACLVGREAQPAFESGVFEAAKLFDDNFAFDYNGPWAPHNFVELNLEL